MPSVSFNNKENRQLFVLEGTTILQAARTAGIDIDSPCGGAGTCGKCRVLVDGSHVLACQTEVLHDLFVYPAPRTKTGTMQILHEGAQLETELLPAVSKIYDHVNNRTKVCFEGGGIGFETGNTANQVFGASVDIGTTTLVVSLVNLLTGETVAEDSALNPQGMFAQDVLSRISYASETGGLETLFSEVTNAINTLLRAVAEKADVKTSHIYEVVYSGNTCMLHMATNVSPESLGVYPYTPVVTGGNCVPAGRLGLIVSPFGRVVLPPILSAYVGADITSGILTVGLHKKKGTTLFIDIGTNGEMVIARNGKLIATSTAAGPAFEGMNIECGMRALNGAVESFDVGPDGIVRVGAIGNDAANGICGSGLVDIAGELVRWGVVTPRGRFTNDISLLPDELAGRLRQHNNRLVFYVDGDVYLSQKDIRQIQLAKGAIRTGIECLLDRVGVESDQVDDVLIAGSFGYHLRARNLIAIGLLPQEFNNKVRFVGNTSKTGGEALLRNYRLRNELNSIVEQAEVVELANTENFQNLFVRSLSFH